MSTQINLPTFTKEDSAGATKLFFDQYGKSPIQYSANELGAAVGFFKEKGFDEEAATVTGVTILRQSKIDGVPVFKIIDTLKELNGLQLSAVVSQILNRYRLNTSTLGFRSVQIVKENQTRNIMP